jgi:hypothetical protein
MPAERLCDVERAADEVAERSGPQPRLDAP